MPPTRNSNSLDDSDDEPSSTTRANTRANTNANTSANTSRGPRSSIPSHRPSNLKAIMKAIDSMVDFQRMENNAHGFYSLKSDMVLIDGGKKRATVATVIWPAPYLPDMFKASGTALRDGSGFKAHVPGIPSYLWKDHETFYNEITRQESEGQDAYGRVRLACDKTKEKHETQATRLKANQDAQMLTFDVHLPAGMKLNLTEFHNGEGNELTTNTVTMTEYDDEHFPGIPIAVGLAYWRFVIEGTEEIRTTKKQKDLSADIAKKMKGLRFPKTNNNMNTSV